MTSSRPKAVPTVLIDNERVVPLTNGAPYYRGEGVEHNVINPTDHDVAFIEIEIKKG